MRVRIVSTIPHFRKCPIGLILILLLPNESKGAAEPTNIDSFEVSHGQRVPGGDGNSELLLLTQSPSQEDIDMHNDFGGIVPLSYDVRIRINAPQLGQLEHSAAISHFNASSSLTFRCSRSTKLILLHAKELTIDIDKIELALDDVSKRSVGKTEDELPTVKTGSKLPGTDDIYVVELSSPTEEGEIYVLTFRQFSGRIKGPFSTGLFAVPLKSALSSDPLIFVTQFQLNDARTVFPCVDLPLFKAKFSLSLLYPVASNGSYFALSNAEVESTTSFTKDGIQWHQTSFRQTPKMPIYAVVFALVPSSYKVLKFLTKRKLPLNVYYDENLISSAQAEVLIEYATLAATQLEALFDVELPLTKLDFLVIPNFVAFGMENWGLVTLSADFLKQNDETEQLSLVAHEIAHQWIGDLVTVRNWRHLCVQEGLTEHYARKVVQRYFLNDDKNKSNRFLLDQYEVRRKMFAVSQETNNVPPLGLIQDFRTVQDVGHWCFGRAPLIFAQLEELIGVRSFEAEISQFITDFALQSYQLSDLAAYFEVFQVQRIPTPTEPEKGRRASEMLEFLFSHGGFPTVFVARDKSDRTAFSLKQRQVCRLKSIDGSKTYQPLELNISWPIPVALKTKSASFPDRSKRQAPMLMDSAMTDSIPVSEFFQEENQEEAKDSAWILVNPDFRYFVRVHYEEPQWQALIRQFLDQPSTFSALTQASLLSDFQFFRKLNMISVSQDTLNLFDQFRAQMDDAARKGLKSAEFE